MADHHADVTDQGPALHRRRVDSEVAPASDTPIHPVLSLQQQVGNRQIARLLASREATPNEDELQTKRDELRSEAVGIEGGPVGPHTEARIQAIRGNGSPLESGARASMEAAFGTSFGDVRVHTNSDADTLNRHLMARAFTTGNDIFLRSDASPTDSRLMAHELTHVVQQRTMSGTGGGMHVGAAGDEHERHADAVAESVVSAPNAPGSAAPTAQRQAAGEEGEEEVQAQHDTLAQRQPAPAPEEGEEVQAQHDHSQREAAPEEEEPS